MTDEEAVRAACVADFCGAPWRPVRLFLGVKVHEFKNWATARAFTDERREQIADVEEEITAVRDVLDDYDATEHTEWSKSFQRILLREQAALTELKKGWKEK